jgi:argonaute-like protein implicated in RNA metabolism and viral defense
LDIQNGKTKDVEEPGEGEIDLRDVLVIETTDNRKLEFEVVGLVEDEEDRSFAIAYSDAEDEFVVTDAKGALLSDTELAQEILEDFRVLAEESGPEEK